ncbi:low molecular weight phosphatase family protein [Candidatus Pacearchaeota archaeon]|nr:low molecular weight phosphatase family protein [Candidatus Pacearchaeota archaeon]
MKILFVCRHNRFRSKVAEAIFNKLNKNKEIQIESAGLILDESRPYVEPVVVSLMKEKGYDVAGTPRQLTRQLADKFEMIVIVADNVSKEFFHDFSGKIIKWEIKDAISLDKQEISRIIDKIEKKVKALTKSL